MNEYTEAQNICTNDCIVNTDDFTFGSYCLICGELVMSSFWTNSTCVCEKCKKAVIYIREHFTDNREINNESNN